MIKYLLTLILATVIGYIIYVMPPSFDNPKVQKIIENNIQNEIKYLSFIAKEDFRAKIILNKQTSPIYSLDKEYKTSLILIKSSNSEKIHFSSPRITITRDWSDLFNNKFEVTIYNFLNEENYTKEAIKQKELNSKQH